MVSAIDVSTKRCPKCGHTKPLRQFKPNRRSADGHDRYCRLCRMVYKSLRYAGPTMPSMADVDWIPQDPAAYAQRVKRLQSIVNVVDATLRWPRRRIVPTRPGLCPDFIEEAA